MDQSNPSIPEGAVSSTLKRTCSGPEGKGGPATQECPETSYLMGPWSAVVVHGKLTQVGCGLRDIWCPWRLLKPDGPRGPWSQYQSEFDSHQRVSTTSVIHTDNLPVAKVAPVRWVSLLCNCMFLSLLLSTVQLQLIFSQTITIIWKMPYSHKK